MRYIAYTIDGSPIFHANSEKELADRVFTHLMNKRKPHIGYTYDEWHYGNYTTWQLRAQLVDYRFKNFSEVADWWTGRHTSNVRKWQEGPPPAIGWWNASVSKSLSTWRWWDGREWSRPVCQENPIKHVLRMAAQKRSYASSLSPIFWTDYWPENAACTPVRSS